MDRTQLIDWSSSESHLLLNPRLPSELKARVKLDGLPKVSGHVWIGSSGTAASGSITFYGLKKTSLLIAAEAANRHLDVKPGDIWILTLPVFHVGGLSIWARAHLGGQSVIDRSLDLWGAEKFHAWVNESHATLAALVPTQVFDLVKFGVKAPASLRAIVVGGAALSEELYFEARELGFPVLPSFGATEACSQIATAELSSLDGDAYPELRVLSHVEVKLMGDDGDSGDDVVSDQSARPLAIRSPSLFTVRVEVTPSVTDMPTTDMPTTDMSTTDVLWRAGEWYVMKDLAELSFDEKDPNCVWLTPRGRAGEFVKISGEMVNVLELSQQFSHVLSQQFSHVRSQQFLQSASAAQAREVTSGDVTRVAPGDFAILPVPDARRGHEIALVLNIKHYREHEAWVREFNAKVVPVARIESVYFVRDLPKTDLGKIRIAELKKLLGIW